MLEACTGWDGSQNWSKTGEKRRVFKAEEEACSEETVKEHDAFGELQIIRDG